MTSESTTFGRTDRADRMSELMKPDLPRRQKQTSIEKAIASFSAALRLEDEIYIETPRAHKESTTSIVNAEVEAKNKKAFEIMTESIIKTSTQRGTHDEQSLHAGTSAKASKKDSRHIRKHSIPRFDSSLSSLNSVDAASNASSTCINRNSCEQADLLEEECRQELHVSEEFIGINTGDSREFRRTQVRGLSFSKFCEIEGLFELKPKEQRKCRGGKRPTIQREHSFKEQPKRNSFALKAA